LCGRRWTDGSCVSTRSTDTFNNYQARPRGRLRRKVWFLAGESALYELEPWGHTLADAWELYLEVGGFPRAVGEFVRDGAVSAGFLQGL
jgi:hypothetical protein